MIRISRSTSDSVSALVGCITGGGKVLYQQSRKRHGMIKRTKKQIRQLRGTNVLFKTDGDNIKKYFLPNG